MTKVFTTNAVKSIHELLSTGQISMNSQITGFPGAPSATLMSLLSTGVIKLSSLSTTLSNGSYGGE